MTSTGLCRTKLNSILPSASFCSFHTALSVSKSLSKEKLVMWPWKFQMSQQTAKRYFEAKQIPIMGAIAIPPPHSGHWVTVIKLVHSLFCNLSELTMLGCVRTLCRPGEASALSLRLGLSWWLLFPPEAQRLLCFECSLLLAEGGGDKGPDLGEVERGCLSLGSIIASLLSARC